MLLVGISHFYHVILEMDKIVEMDKIRFPNWGEIFLISNWSVFKVVACVFPRLHHRAGDATRWFDAH